MLTLPFLTTFSKLSVSPVIQQTARTILTASSLNFKLTQELYAEPLKKKKRIDPMIIKAREERRRKKIEKQIRRLEKNARQLKPIEECEVPLNILDSLNERRRPNVVLTADEIESRSLLQKAWTRYKHTEMLADIKEIDRMCSAQTRALDELYKESEELYDEAIAVDMELVPFTTRGPVSTPPVKGYSSPDGEYIDISKKWDN